MSLIPELGRSSREGNGYPLQYFWLENSMDRGAEESGRLQSIGSQRVRHDWGTKIFTSDVHAICWKDGQKALGWWDIYGGMFLADRNIYAHIFLLFSFKYFLLMTSSSCPLFFFFFACDSFEIAQTTEFLFLCVLRVFYFLFSCPYIYVSMYFSYPSVRVGLCPFLKAIVY